MFNGLQDYSLLELILIIAVYYWPLVLFLTGAVVFGMWKVFKKTGHSGWKSLIPFYNLYILTDIANLKSWYATVTLIQILAITAALLFIGADFIIVESIVPVSAPAFASFADQIASTYQLPVVTKMLSVTIIATLIYLFYGIAKRFKRGISFALGLSFLPFVFWPILGKAANERNSMKSDSDSETRKMI